MCSMKSFSLNFGYGHGFLVAGVVLNGTRGRGFHLNDFRSKLQASFFNSYVSRPVVKGE